jgi:hypothetical protein
MTRLALLTVVMLAFNVMALIGDVTGYAKRSGDSGWNVMALVAIVAWVIAMFVAR